MKKVVNVGSIIKLDYDKITTRDIQLIFHYRAWLLKYFGIRKVECYETKRGYHVLVDIEEKLNPRDVLLIQLLMGSDIHREIYNFLRKFEGELIEAFNKLYTKKYLILGTKIKEELSSEKECPILYEKVMKEIERAKNLRGVI